MTAQLAQQAMIFRVRSVPSHRLPRRIQPTLGKRFRFLLVVQLNRYFGGVRVGQGQIVKSAMESSVELPDIDE